MSLVQQQSKFLMDVALLIQYANRLGIVLTGGELYRTVAQQKIYIKEGKSKTMNSNHLKRLAIDFNFFIDNELTYSHEKIKKLGTFWESLSPYNRWGGNYKNFKDTPHFERRQTIRKELRK